MKTNKIIVHYTDEQRTTILKAAEILLNALSGESKELKDVPEAKGVDDETIKNKNMITSRNYTEADFRNANPSCSLQDMNQDVIDKLDIIADTCIENRIPKPRITCAYRSHSHDVSRGRAGTSAHIPRDENGNVVADDTERGVGSLAIDAATPDSRARYFTMMGVYRAGIRRIGINLASNFYHTDTSPHHDQDVLFTY